MSTTPRITSYTICGNINWPVPWVNNAQRQSNHLGTHDSSTCTIYMPCTECGKVINNPTFLATSVWSKIDSETYATPKLTSYTMCVNIIEISFGLCLVWIMPRGRATILEHIKAVLVQCTLGWFLWAPLLEIFERQKKKNWIPSPKLFSPTRRYTRSSINRPAYNYSHRVG